MSVTFEALDRADEFVYAVGRRIGSRLATLGVAAWNTDPAHARERARTASLLNLAGRKVARIEDGLVRAGRATPGEITRRRTARNTEFLARAAR